MLESDSCRGPGDVPGPTVDEVPTHHLEEGEPHHQLLSSLCRFLFPTWESMSPQCGSFVHVCLSTVFLVVFSFLFVSDFDGHHGTDCLSPSQSCFGSF